MRRRRMKNAERSSRVIFGAAEKTTAVVVRLPDATVRSMIL